MKKMKILILFSLLLGFKASISQGAFSIHLGPSLPMADFKDDDLSDEDAGWAGIGLNIGLKYVHPLSDNGLGLFGGVDLMMNPYSKDVRDDIDDFDDDSDFTFPKYLSIPISAGLNYDFIVDDQLSLFAKFGLGLNFLKLTKFTWEEVGDDDYIETYNVATGFGFVFGAGVLLNEKVEFALTYYGLGEHDIEGEYEYGSDSGDLDKTEKKISLMTVTVGINLN